MKIEYMDNKKNHGIKYDFSLIKKTYNKLKVPKEFYNPCYLLDTGCAYNILLSERARGKTTNLLLLGLVFNQLYGTTIQYIRSKDAKITKSQIINLFSTIVDCGYITRLTEEKYNSVCYNSRRFYLCKRDEDGEIIEKSEKHFFIALAVERAEDYKSSYDSGGVGDFVIFDEFIEKFFYPNEFIDFCQLLSTILRRRKSGLIFMCANTLTKASPWYRELMITKEIDALHQGECAYILTPKGTKLYVEMLGRLENKQLENQNTINRLYFGFNNEKLVSITGASDWALFNYPHTPSYEYTVLDRKHYLRYNNKLLRLEFCIDELTLFVNVHPATKTYDDSIIYDLEFSLSPYHRYGFGNTKNDKKLWSLYKENKFVYSDNTIGELVESYVNECNRKGIRA